MVFVQKEIKRVTIRPNGQEKQIRPTWWKPTSDVIAYYPLETDVNDYNWNYNLTNSWTTFTTLNGVKCANFTSNVYAYSTNVPLPSWSNARTILFYSYNTAADRDVYRCGYGSHSTWRFFAPRMYEWYIGVMFYGSSDTRSTTPPPTNQWNLYAFTLSSWTCKLYLDTNLIMSKPVSANTTAVSSTWKFTVWCRLNSSQNPWEYYKWYMGDLILSNKEWSQQEIADYYNLTKSKYWL